MHPQEPDVAGEEIEISGFSVVLFSRAFEAPARGRLLHAFQQRFELGCAPIDTDPLPLGDRAAVLEALGAAEAVVETGLAAVYEGDGVMKIVTPEHGILVVEHVAAPYFDDPDAVIETLRDVRFAKDLRDHIAFLEIGLLGLEVVEQPLAASRLLCRFAAAFCDPDVVGVAVPDRGLLAPNHPAVVAALCGEDPFDWPDLEEDVEAREIAAEDRDFDRAAEEARRRFPEFAAAFADPRPGDAFSVKIGVFEGEVCENLWFWLRAIDGDRIQCELESEPIYLTGIRRGEVRGFDVAELLDWVRTEASGQTFGGFTLAR